MSKENFESLIKQVTSAVSSVPLDDNLAVRLNAEFPGDGEAFEAIHAACLAGIEEGWMCDREQGGIKFGRVVKDSDGFSVDVVQMKDVVGPHYRHPKGEIDMVMPLSPGAKFDGHDRGWVVYGADSAHNPTVSDGEALVLYLAAKSSSHGSD